MHPLFKLTAILIYGTLFAKSLEFVEQDYQSGLIFQKISDARITYDSFVLLYHADLKPLFEIKDKILELYEILQKYCKHEPQYCDVIYLTIDRRLAILDKYEVDMKLYQAKTPNREKRWVMAVGIVGSIFIGLINAIQADQYKREIDRLNIDYTKMTMIQHDSLLFLKENIITQRNVTSHLNGVTKALISDFRKHTKQNIIYQAEAYRYLLIEKIERLINHWFLEHDYASKIILDHLHSAMYGKFSQLISTNEFKNDLLEIEKLLSDQQQLPINIHAENPLNIFKFATTKTIIYDSRLLIEITIPKMDREQYTLYKVIPTPIHSSGFINIIIPSMDYVLIDQSTANFIPTTSKEFENAPSNNRMEKIIAPNANIFHDFRDNCEMTLKLNFHGNNLTQLCNFRTIPITNYFVSISSFNKYFISLVKPTTLIEFCPKKPIYSKRITKSGLLTLSDNCKIQTDKITLRPRIQTVYEDHTEIQIFSDLPKISFEALQQQLQNVSQPSDLHSLESSLLIDDHIDEFNNLADRTDQLIEQISDRNIYDEIYVTKIKHNFYIVIGIMSCLFIIIIIIAHFLHSKFYNIETWTNLAKRFANPNDQPRIQS